MAFDGLTIHALTKELKDTLTGGRIYKIAQPEKDELFLTIKTPGGQYRLLISANPSLPLVYISTSNKQAPLTAPNFCMLLRKHLNNGRIVNISQPGLERIIDFQIEHLNELGDLCTKHLIVELMGKYSNIIFTDDNSKIIDSIKRINAFTSSVREVLPGYDYFIPNTAGKTDPISADYSFADIVFTGNKPVSKAIYEGFTGISPMIAYECCSRSGIDNDAYANMLTSVEQIHLAGIFSNMMDDVKKQNFTPCIIYEDNNPKDFSVIRPSACNDVSLVLYDSISLMLETYYSEKNNKSRIRQYSANLRQVVQTLLDRNYKKYQLQQTQLKDTEKRDKYRIYGELINTYGYNIPEGSKSFTALNYYTNEEISIPLEPTLSPRENSLRYFARYNKLKRTYEALSELTLETKREIDHLESVNTAINIATSYDDILQIKEELIQYGFIKNHATAKRGRVERSKSKPLHYVSSDGYDMYVGKNNLQNEYLTFKFADGNDWWFHAKQMPGSHVIVKSNGNLLPDKTFEEAAALAAYYSKGQNQSLVEVDYVEKKHVKKVAKAAPGFVIYHTNYSMNIAPDISKINICQ